MEDVEHLFRVGTFAPRVAGGCVYSRAGCEYDLYAAVSHRSHRNVPCSRSFQVSRVCGGSRLRICQEGGDYLAPEDATLLQSLRVAFVQAFVSRY